MKAETIAVVIPTFNRPGCLLVTLDLLSKQRRLPEEIIIVDQTPTYTEADKRNIADAVQTAGALYLQQDEPNASKARNEGLRRAKSDIVLFLDDDILFGPDLVGEHLSAYRDSQIVGVAGQVRVGGQVRSERHPLSRIRTFGWLFFPMNHTRESWLSSGQSCNLSVLTREARGVGGMDENYRLGGFREESDFCLRYSRAFGALKFVPSAWIDTLSSPTGGIRTLPASRMSRHHLACEMYFIRKNISLLEIPVHVACCFLRQWRLRVSTLEFCVRSVPAILAQFLRTFLGKLEPPRYI